RLGLRPVDQTQRPGGDPPRGMDYPRPHDPQATPGPVAATVGSRPTTGNPLSGKEVAMAEPLTILFMPESAYGPTNNCVGIGDVLRQRGHRVVFAAEASGRGRPEPLGFAEDLVDLAPPVAAADEPGDAPDAGQFWKEFI